MPQMPTLVTLARRARPVPCRVRVIGGDDAGLEVPVPQDGVTAGTDVACGLRLSDKKVSRRHVRVRPTAAGFEVQDLESTNGTFVDGNVVARIVVRSGTDIQLGGTTLRLLPAEEPVAVEPLEQPRHGPLVGASVAMRELFALMERAAAADAPVLLQGETGTGKDLVATTIHANSPRAGHALEVLDCGAIPPGLIESELFGHVRGAFTGAAEDRAGAFQRAHGGTVFLDEIGELPLELQPRFLRVLESGQIRPVGGDRSRRVDVRVIAASHRQIPELVQQGRFRADLYYRLAVVCLQIPPLRARAREDLPPLVRHLLGQLAVADPGPIEGPNLERLERYSWPGNVRELRNVIERGVTLGGGPGRVRFASMPISFGAGAAAPTEPRPAVDYSVPYAEARQQALAAFERSYLRGLLDGCGGNVSEAARVSGLSRKSLYQMMKRHGLGR